MKKPEPDAAFMKEMRDLSTALLHMTSGFDLRLVAVAFARCTTISLLTISRDREDALAGAAKHHDDLKKSIDRYFPTVGDVGHG